MLIIYPPQIKGMHELKGLAKEQEGLARKVSLRDGFKRLERVAGADLSFSDEKIFSSVVVCSHPSMEVLETATHESRVGFPYIPGFLSYREAPSIARAFKRLKTRPDILLVDGQGICHPRGIGLASHLGITLDVPAIGVAKSRLCGEARGKGIFLKGRQVGWLLETRPGARPLYVSPGHRVSLESSLEIARSCIRDHRLPEPLRLAHLYSREKK
jgi:deoxyribonuclease V